MKRKIFLIALAITFIGMIGYLVSKEMKAPEVYTVVKPEKRTIQKKTVANGSVVPRFEIMIKPTVSGIISELMVKAGDFVKKGDVLAKIQIVPDMISLSSSESRVRQAKISVENAQRNFDRNKALFDKGVIAQAEMDQFRLMLNNAIEDQRGAVDNLSVVREGISRSSGSSSNTLVRSTIDGMVLDVPIEKGNSVIERNNFNEGTTIASVADMKDLIFEGNLDESEVGKVRLGMPIVLTIGAIDDAKWDAEVEYIAPKGIEKEGAIQFEIKAAVKLQEGQTLRAGYSANADIVLQEQDSVLSIPESVITFNDEGDSAYVQVKNGETWDRTYIATGLSDGIYIEVLNGITESSELKGALIIEEKDEPKKGGQ